MFSGQPVNSQPQPLEEEPIQPEIPTHSKFSFIKAIKLWQIVFLLILLIPATAFFLSKNQSNQQIACTMEAKLCPDGTSVGRTGPKCEFSPCPTPTANPTANWNTHLSETSNLSFKYPQGFSVKEEKKSDATTTRYDFTFTTGKLINGETDWSGFSVFVIPTDGKTIDQKFLNQPNGFGESKIGVNKLSSQQSGNADEAADLINAGNGIRVYRLKDKFFEIYTFQNGIILSDRSDDITSYINQILSTFTFTQNSIATYIIQVGPSNGNNFSFIELTPQNAGQTIKVSVGEDIWVKFPDDQGGYKRPQVIPAFGEPGGDIILPTAGAASWPNFRAKKEGTVTILINQ